MFDLKTSKIKNLSRSIIEDYTYYVRDEVKKGRKEYLDTGIDNNLNVYREFFLNILAFSLGMQDRAPNIDSVVKEELISIIRRDLSYRRYSKLASSNRVMIYSTCSVIFDKVVEGILGGDKHGSR